MDNKQVKLSKSILDMKFMKRTKDRVQKEAQDAESQAMYANEITDEMRQTGNIVFVNTSLKMCKEYIDGRLSFGGMNPEIEKLMANEYYKQLEEAERLKEKDVTDVEMAQGYSTVVDTVGKKFNKKRNRNKNKFLKPNDF